MGSERELWQLREMEKKCVKGGEWVREAEVGLGEGKRGRLEAWVPLPSFLRSHPCRRRSWLWEGPALGTAGCPASSQGQPLKIPFLL